MRMVFNSTIQDDIGGSKRLWFSDLPEDMEGAGIDVAVGDWSNYQSYDIAFFKAGELEVAKARKDNPDLLIGVYHPTDLSPETIQDIQQADFFLAVSDIELDYYLKYNRNYFLFPNIERIAHRLDKFICYLVEPRILQGASFPTDQENFIAAKSSYELEQELSLLKTVRKPVEMVVGIRLECPKCPVAQSRQQQQGRPNDEPTISGVERGISQEVGLIFVRTLQASGVCFQTNYSDSRASMAMNSRLSSRTTRLTATVGS